MQHHANYRQPKQHRHSARSFIKLSCPISAWVDFRTSLCPLPLNSSAVPWSPGDSVGEGVEVGTVAEPVPASSSPPTPAYKQATTVTSTTTCTIFPRGLGGDLTAVNGRTWEQPYFAQTCRRKSLFINIDKSSCASGVQNFRLSKPYAAFVSSGCQESCSSRRWARFRGLRSSCSACSLECWGLHRAPPAVATLPPPRLPVVRLRVKATPSGREGAMQLAWRR